MKIMMIETDVRKKIVETADGKKTLNVYWEGLLDSQKKAFLFGYDIATEHYNSAFDSLREQLEDAPVKNAFAQDVIDDTQGFVTLEHNHFLRIDSLLKRQKQVADTLL